MRNLYYTLLKLYTFPMRLFSKVDYNVILKNSIIHKKCAIAGASRVYNSSIDRYTYVGKNATICNTKIGSFCSIADNCIISPGKHPIDRVSSSPLFYSKRNIFNESFIDVNFEEYDNTTIGNDVWIGSHSFIKGGVKIGHGAIIGAYSIVTKDVEPYSIVVGNPAKEIRKRFNKEEISYLLEIKWWNFNKSKLKKSSEYFDSPKNLISFVKEKWKV